MPGRRKGREIALQILYQADWERQMDPQEMEEFATRALEEYEKDLAPANSVEDPELRDFIRDLVTGVLHRRSRVDEIIKRFSKGWKIQRMAMVDRNILRLGIYELCFHPDIPPKVAINEAVELAKRFSDANSPAFVNGILDSVYRKHCQKKMHLKEAEG